MGLDGYRRSHEEHGFTRRGWAVASPVRGPSAVTGNPLPRHQRLGRSQLAVLHGREEIGFSIRSPCAPVLRAAHHHPWAGARVVRSVGLASARPVEPSSSDPCWSASAQPLSGVLAGLSAVLWEDPQGVSLTGKGGVSSEAAQGEVRGQVSPHEPDVLIRESGRQRALVDVRREGGTWPSSAH